MRKQVIALLLLSVFISGCVAVAAGTAAGTGAALASDRRTAGTIVEDKSIQLKAFQAANQVTKDEKSHIGATAYNMRLLLVGQVPTRAMKNQIDAEVKKIKNVRHFHNELTVEAPTSVKIRSKDSWITTRIKSEMTLHKINPTRVKITTENGVVYLLGIVHRDEEAAITDIARQTKGVKKVVKIFDYENVS